MQEHNAKCETHWKCLFLLNKYLDLLFCTKCSLYRIIWTNKTGQTHSSNIFIYLISSRTLIPLCALRTQYVAH